jgi:hypothetical protein
MGEMKNAYKILVGKPEGKRPHGRPRYRWVDIRETEWEGVDLIHLAQNMDHWQALGNMVINLRVPHKAGNFSTS